VTSGSDSSCADDPGHHDEVLATTGSGNVTAAPPPGGPVDRHDTGDAADEAAPPPGGTKPLPVWQESALLVGTAVILALLIKTFFVQAFYIPPSGSMRDSLEDNDRILVQKVSYWFSDPQRGDIVVFDDPADWLGDESGSTPGNVFTQAMSFVGLYPSGGHLVKRVIGVGGDAVACRRGAVDVNGTALQESGYVTLSRRACDGHWSVVVPPGDLWVLGDNRQHSADSRAHMGDPGGGFVPVDDVVGRAFVVVWPVHRWQLIHRPSTFANPQLDKAAGIISATAPSGLAALAVPALLRRRKATSARKAAFRARKTRTTHR
jgi:signal peptidase I